MDAQKPEHKQVAPAAFETLLIASLDMLRSDYYTRATALLSQAAQTWEPHYDAVVGTTLHDCEGGGTINRDVDHWSEVARSAQVNQVSAFLLDVKAQYAHSGTV